MPDLAKKPKKKKRGSNHSNLKQRRWKELSVIEGHGTPLKLSNSVEGERSISYFGLDVKFGH